MAGHGPAGFAALDQARVAEHVEVLHDGRQRHRERPGELAHREVLVLVEPGQQGAPRRVGQGSEGAVENSILIVNHRVKFEAARRRLSRAAGTSSSGPVTVDYSPGGKSQPHTHAKSAFIYAYVVSGAIRSQVDNEPAKIYRAGEGFFEMPGAHHRISENASDSEPARLLAVFVVDPAETLTIPDPR